jgi:hypothetical protein
MLIRAPDDRGRAFLASAAAPRLLQPVATGREFHQQAQKPGGDATRFRAARYAPD